MKSRAGASVLCFVGVLCGLCAPPAWGQQPDGRYTPSAANIAAREWFQDAKFGMFVHWGVYSTLADGEWVMEVRKIPIAAYERLPHLFNPTEFNAEEWVSLVKAAGMRYLTITAKHHDGFAMYDSRVSDYDIVDRTPYKRDVLKQLADECRRQGIKLFFYYSQLDWHHADYYPRGQTGRNAGRPEGGDWGRYLDTMDVQLAELLKGYGEVAGIWFDGYWDRPDADWRLRQTYDHIHELQPQALIGANHHGRTLPGEDFQMFEKDLPGHNTAGFSAEAVISQLPLETCETINGSWGFNLLDRSVKSTPELIRLLVRAAGYNANLLLNVGPMANGEVPEEQAERLREIGDWLKVYGVSVYGTRGGPVSPRPWGVTTQKENLVYVHVLDWPERTLVLPSLASEVAAARTLAGSRSLRFRQAEEGLLLSLPPRAADEVDQVVVLELKRPLHP